MFDHPQVLAEGIVSTIEHPLVGRYRGVAQSIRFGRTPGPAPFAAPVLGKPGQGAAWSETPQEPGSD
jgi:crotonobetainyl-CoA:carnitine CoA-transferase CaiB-like acyl-CoA transferase